MRKRLINHFAGLVPFEVEKNLTRLAMGLAAALNAKAENAMGSALEHARNTLETVERLLRSTPDTMDKIESALAGFNAAHLPARDRNSD